MDGTPATSRKQLVLPGAVVEILPAERGVTVYRQRLVVVHEDDAFAVVVKPPGLWADAASAAGPRSRCTVASILPFTLQPTSAMVRATREREPIAARAPQSSW